MIRPAFVDDLDALYELEVACFAARRFQRDHVLGLLKHPRAATYVFESGPVLGSLMLLDEGQVTRVLSVGVHPGFRRKGIGTHLMRTAEEAAEAWGATEVRLEVSTRNRDAIAFYHALGYETVGHMPKYYSWGDDADVMRKGIALEVRKS